MVGLGGREREREREVASLYLLRLRLRGGLGNGLIWGVENWVGTRPMKSHTRIRVERIGCVTMTNYYGRDFKAFLSVLCLIIIYTCNKPFFFFFYSS